MSDEQQQPLDPLASVPNLEADSHYGKAPPAMDEFTEYKHMMAKPRGFWFQASVVQVVVAVAERKMLVSKGAELLDTTIRKMQSRAALYRKFGPSMGFGGVAKTIQDSNVLVGISYDQISKNHIDWARFLDLETPEYFDLRRISAMCYASERIINWKPKGRVHQLPDEFVDVREKAGKFVALWAVYFGKYALAACLGEFRHRKTAGPVKLVPMGRGKIARTAAQSAAENLWPNKENTVRAAAWMADKFSDLAYFTGGGFGGRPWARIADTLLKWLKGDIPDIVWVDYVWDLSHNAGRFFDKCHLWQEEQANRTLLTMKRTSKTGDVREWGEEFLHPEWKAGLDLIEVMDIDEPEEV